MKGVFIMKKFTITLTEKAQYRLEIVMEDWNSRLKDEDKYTMNNMNDLFNVLLYKEFDKIISKGE